MSDVAPLLYLEVRMAINRFRQVLRQPARLALWALFLAWLSLFFFTRLARVSDGSFSLFMSETIRFVYAFVPAAYIIILGMQVVSASRRPPATFSYPADARFLFGSRLSHVVVIFWLQAREAAFSGSRLFLALFFISWNFAGSAGGLMATTTVLLAAYIIAFGIRLPVFLAQRRLHSIPFATVGTAFIAAGLLALLFPVALAVVSDNLRFSFIALQTAVFPPGSWIVEALTGSRQALAALCMPALMVILGGSLAASDAYPEIWEASSRLYAIRALIQSGRGLWNRDALRCFREGDQRTPAIRARRSASASGEDVPAGAFSLLWKEWIATRRSQGGLTWPLLRVCGACALGYFAGLAASNLSLMVFLAPAAAIANIIVVIGSQSTVNLGVELRKPIWWLAESPLRSRILAWIFGMTLRGSPALSAGAMAAGIAMHSWLAAAASVPIVVIGLFLIQGIGVASYVVLPGRTDLRGPGFMLRILATYLSLAPPAICWAAAATVTQNSVAGIAIGLAIASIEAWMLAMFAADRLEQNAMAYAAAEQR